MNRVLLGLTAWIVLSGPLGALVGRILRDRQ